PGKVVSLHEMGRDPRRREWQPASASDQGADRRRSPQTILPLGRWPDAALANAIEDCNERPSLAHVVRVDAGSRAILPASARRDARVAAGRTADQPRYGRRYRV